MSLTRKLIVATAGAAAGLFLGALATSATAAADPVANPVPGLPGLVEQFVTSPGGIGQQILQTTTAALGGAPALPAAPATPPLANATINLPQTSPVAGTPLAPSTPAGLASVPGDISRMLPFPMPNLGTTPTAPALTSPVSAVPSVVAPPATLTLPQTIEPMMRFPVSALP